MAYTSNVTFLPSASRAPGTAYSGEFNLYYADEVLVFLDVTAVGASATLDVTVQTKDPNGKWYDLATFTQKTAVGQEAKPITVFGETLRIKYTVGVANVTFSVTGIAKTRG